MLLMFRRPKARPGNMHKRPASKNLDILRQWTFRLHHTHKPCSWTNLDDVVVAARREDINHDRILDGGRPVLDAPANDETIAGSKVEYLSLTGDFK